MRHRLAWIMLLLVALFASMEDIHFHPADAKPLGGAWHPGDPCPDVLVVGARGSGQSSATFAGVGPEVFGFSGQLAAALRSSSVAVLANPYPAVPISAGLPAILDSVDQGRTNTRVLVAAVADQCATKTKIVLAGYSQGAMTAKSGADFVRSQDMALVAGIAVFADPQFDPNDAATLIGTFDNSKGGVFGRVDIPAYLQGRGVSVCLKNDPVCQGESTPTFAYDLAFHSVVHTQGYQDVDLQHEAAAIIANRLNPPAQPKLDLVFSIDTTGSMSPYIQGAVGVASDVVNTLVTKGVDFRIGVVDYKDADNCGDYDAVTDLGFSTDKTAIINAINTLPGKVGGGCDTPEDVYSGLMRAIGFPWRNGVKKEIIVMGDAPPKDPEPHTGFTAAKVIAAANAVDPAAINPILVGGDPSATQAFTSLADGTGGQTFNSNDSDVSTTILDAINAIITGPSCDHVVTGKVPALVLTTETWCLRNATVAGGIDVPAGGSLVVSNSSVGGGIGAKGANFVQFCGSTIVGGVDIEQSSGAVVIGDVSNHACKRNTLSGLILKGNFNGVSVSNNDAQSVLLASNVGPPVVVEANGIHYTLVCTDNTPPPTDNGHHNSVGLASTGQCSSLTTGAPVAAATSLSSTTTSLPSVTTSPTPAPTTSTVPTTTTTAFGASPLASTTTSPATSTTVARRPGDPRCDLLGKQYDEASLSVVKSQLIVAMQAAGCPTP